jgi:serine phosphatase RsbU (regulator of sigma subunit)
VIEDIAGKGTAGALLMANLQANLRSQCAIVADQPQLFLRSVNQLFYENTADGDYSTFFFAEYDDETRRLHCANCGHLVALLLRRLATDDRFARIFETRLNQCFPMAAIATLSAASCAAVFATMRTVQKSSARLLSVR